MTRHKCFAAREGCSGGTAHWFCRAKVGPNTIKALREHGASAGDCHIRAVLPYLPQAEGAKPLSHTPALQPSWLQPSPWWHKPQVAHLWAPPGIPPPRE